MKPWTITAGILGALAMFGGPIAALEFADNRYASVALERIYLEDKVLELEEQCEEEESDPALEARLCERYLRAKAELCLKYPESWLCRE